MTKTINISKENYFETAKLLPQLNENFDIGFSKNIGKKTLEITFLWENQAEIEPIIIETMDNFVDIAIVFDRKDKTLVNLEIALKFLKVSNWTDEDKNKWVSSFQHIGLYIEDNELEFLRKNRIQASGLLEVNFNNLLKLV